MLRDNIRANKDRNFLHIGFYDTFDKWGNSSDLTENYPVREADLDKILQKAERAIRCDHKDGKYRCTTWIVEHKPHLVKNKAYCDEHFDEKVKNGKAKR